jgi:hypothetical protein
MSGSSTEVWAQLILCDKDRARVHEFLSTGFGIIPRSIAHTFHITLYRGRGSTLGQRRRDEAVEIVIAAAQTRFMVLTPGGEEARAGIEPGEKKVGVRIQKSAECYDQLCILRGRFVALEQEYLAAGANRNTVTRNAYGPIEFKPHMLIVREGNGLGRDLRPIGEAFRSQIGDLRFDTLRIDVGRASRDD